MQTTTTPPCQLAVAVAPSSGRGLPSVAPPPSAARLHYGGETLFDYYKTGVFRVTSIVEWTKTVLTMEILCSCIMSEPSHHFYDVMMLAAMHRLFSQDSPNEYLKAKEDGRFNEEYKTRCRGNRDAFDEVYGQHMKEKNRIEMCIGRYYRAIRSFEVGARQLSGSILDDFLEKWKTKLPENENWLGLIAPTIINILVTDHYKGNVEKYAELQKLWNTLLNSTLGDALK